MSFNFETIALILVALLVGASPYILSIAGNRVNQIPQLKRIRDDYPVINVALKMAADNTDDATLLGLVADAAYQIWSERDVTDDQAQAAAAAAARYFDKQKFKNTDVAALDRSIIEKGREIGRQLSARKVS